MTKPEYVRFFEEFGIEDVPLVGGKNASLGEMYQKLSDEGVRVPNGFAITAEAYRYMLETSRALESSARRARWARPDRRRRPGPPRQACPRDRLRRRHSPMTSQRRSSPRYRRLQEEYGEEVSLAVRSSATAEDLPTASFAGQQETFLNVRGDESLLDACRRCFASLFTDRCHPLPHRPGLRPLQGRAVDRRDEDGALRPRLRPGVMFSLDTESGFRDVVSSPAPTGWARTSSRARSTPTSSTSTSRPSTPGTAPCSAVCSATRR